MQAKQNLKYTLKQGETYIIVKIAHLENKWKAERGKVRGLCQGRGAGMMAVSPPTGDLALHSITL